VNSDLSLIEVPAMAGDPSHPAAAGPGELADRFVAERPETTRRKVEIPRFGGDHRAASLEVCGRIAHLVQRAQEAGRRPLVLAGSCDVAPGVLAGLRDPGVNVVWVDAHADFNTPASSESGFWPGMALAVVCGDCGHDVWAELRARPIAPSRVALVGVRDFSPPAEKERLAASGVTVLEWRCGSPREPLEDFLEKLANRPGRIYLHLDLDALDPAVAPGVVDSPASGGLSCRQLEAVLEALSGRVAACTIATYVPALDDGRTRAAALDAMKRLAQPADP
jgi:arginase